MTVQPPPWFVAGRCSVCGSAWVVEAIGKEHCTNKGCVKSGLTVHQSEPFCGEESCSQHPCKLCGKVH